MTASTWHNDPEHVFRIRSAEGSFDGYLARPAAVAAPAIVVLHEVFGVNVDLRATCDELAAAGFIAICPELFWRQGESHVDLSVQSQPDWEKGLALYKAFDIDAGVRDVEATIAAARPLTGAVGRVGVMGFCLGGLLTFLAAARTRVDAAVAFHGGRTEEFLGETADIDGPLQMHLAEEDEFIPKKAQREIAAALAGNPKFEVFSYPGCRHAFSRHGGMHFNAEAARLSRARTFAFFNRELA
ncbi:dienelactone hydrolase family protein [Polyangium aurulentum]|uniref:dienelactone hydrolase family protein n=1 Tax=Polyangium aurulentum TaxID=2567896 RepID=UPI0010AE01ED|nr:dienelactone hydrolase family protein [Polyangium aurulentum]UQA59953.1 dienelactone hydrolase family protein [Polyangium aurulentum]